MKIYTCHKAYYRGKREEITIADRYEYVSLSELKDFGKIYRIDSDEHTVINEEKPMSEIKSIPAETRNFNTRADVDIIGVETRKFEDSEIFNDDFVVIEHSDLKASDSDLKAAEGQKRRWWQILG